LDFELGFRLLSGIVSDVTFGYFITITHETGVAMREKRDPQLSLFHLIPRNEIGKELEAISKIIDENLGILDAVHWDLVGVKSADTGRTGMTAEQAFRCAILKQYRNLTYEELAFHVEDSRSFRAFAKLWAGQRPSASTLQENVKALSDASWEAANRMVLEYARREGLEKGRTIRLDSTAVETDIHYPTDSSLLVDGVRVITRLLIAGKACSRTPAYCFADHRRVVKKRALRILNSNKESVRTKCYRDLLEIAMRVKGYAIEAIRILEGFNSPDFVETIRARGLAEELRQVLETFDKVMDQTRRRVLEGEKVPASEKVVSFFETHADIIEKGNRETTYGHKLFVVGGESGLILDCMIERGNPADSAMFLPLLDRQEDLYRRVPRQMAADGGFASRDNLKKAKENGICDVCFSKGRGIPVMEMVKSTWVYKKLRNFRAAIEACVSVLKRAFGLTRCCWSGWGPDSNNTCSAPLCLTTC
jgi:transposase, IS5 family